MPPRRRLMKTAGDPRPLRRQRRSPSRRSRPAPAPLGAVERQVGARSAQSLASASHGAGHPLRQLGPALAARIKIGVRQQRPFRQAGPRSPASTGSARISATTSPRSSPSGTVQARGRPLPLGDQHTQTCAMLHAGGNSYSPAFNGRSLPSSSAADREEAADRDHAGSPARGRWPSSCCPAAKTTVGVGASGPGRWQACRPDSRHRQRRRRRGSAAEQRAALHGRDAASSL